MSRAHTTRPHVHVLFTGGTISMRIDLARGAAVPALSGAQILARVRGARREARLSLEDHDRLPGPHVTPAWMWRLRARIARLVADPSVDGVVVTHGTDTLEETAYLVDLTLRTPKPVVFCGAMRTLSEAGWDGPSNLLAAGGWEGPPTLRAGGPPAAAPEARNRGVLIVLGEEIHAAAEATKWHTQHLAAFHSPHGPLGVADRDRLVFHRRHVPPRHVPARRLVTRVDLHLMAAGVDGRLIRASLARGARGLVVAGTGCGNVPPAVVPALRAALDAGIPVVLASRCPEGRVVPAYGYVGGGRRLADMGLVFAPELSPAKARIHLMVALGTSRRPEDVKRCFEAVGD